MESNNIVSEFASSQYLKTITTTSDKNETLTTYEIKYHNQIIPISIKHYTSSTLKKVGHQLWNGSLIMSDFILNAPTLFNKKTILELGTGTGLVSIILSHPSFNIKPKNVFASDLKDVIHYCELNFILNGIDCIRTRHFDFCDPNHPVFTNLTDQMDVGYAWNELDLIDFNDCEIIIACDVIYDDEITCKFVDTIGRLLMLRNRAVYLSFEKRVHFNVDGVVCSPAFDYFIECISDWNFKNEREMVVCWIDIKGMESFFFNDCDSIVELIQIKLK